MWWTYFIQSIHGGPIKIGRTSRTPEERLRDHVGGSPLELHIVGLLRGDMESELHARFAKERIRRPNGSLREWFRPSRNLREFIERECQQELTPFRIRWASIERESSRVKLKDVVVTRVSDASFDTFLPNDDEHLDMLITKLSLGDNIIFADDLPEEWKGIGIGIASEDVYADDVVHNMCMTIYEEAFVEGVGIDQETWVVAFICLPTTAIHHEEIIDTLADLALFMHDLAEPWLFVVVTYVNKRQIAIDLRRRALGLPGRIWDPAADLWSGRSPPWPPKRRYDHPA